MAPTILHKDLTDLGDIQYIHFHWTDLSGVLRARVLPRASCETMIMNGQVLRVGPGAVMGHGLDISDLPEWFVPGGCDSVIPDWTSCRMLNDYTASVMCNVSEVHASHLDADPLHPLLRCPRNTLQRVVERASTDFELSALVGFELEFYLLRTVQVEAPEVRLPAHNHWSAASSLRSDLGLCLHECVSRLNKCGLEVYQFHAECGSQQYEISLQPRSPIEAVDDMLRAKEIIKRTASERSLHATFSPKPVLALPPSGLHTHISIRHNAKQTDTTVPLAKEEHFLAGVLQFLTLLCAISMPSAESYERVSHFNIGRLVGWGTGNRDLPIRKIAPGHWEVRTFDATCNVYLSLAAYLAAGLIGIEDQQELTLKDCRVATCRFNGESLKEFGMVDFMPRTLEEALFAKVLETDKYKSLNRFLGEKILLLHAAVKKKEANVLASLSEADRKALMIEEF